MVKDLVPDSLWERVAPLLPAGATAAPVPRAAAGRRPGRAGWDKPGQYERLIVAVSQPRADLLPDDASDDARYITGVALPVDAGCLVK